MLAQLVLSAVAFVPSINAECNAIYQLDSSGSGYIPVVPIDRCQSVVSSHGWSFSQNYACENGNAFTSIFETLDCSGTALYGGDMGANYTCFTDAGECSVAFVTESNCNGESAQFYFVVDECATSDDGMYSAMNVCNEDGIFTTEMNGGDCTGTPINTEELFLINKTCTELSCAANILEETGDIDVSELYINIGTRRRRENRQYVCESIASSGVFSFLPFARPHIHQPRSNFPMAPKTAPVATPDSLFLSLTTKDIVIAFLVVMNIVLLMALYCGAGPSAKLQKPYKKVDVDTDAEDDRLVA